MSKYLFFIIFIISISFLILQNNFIYNNLLKEQKELIKDVHKLQEEIKEKLFLLEKNNIKNNPELEKKTIIIDSEKIDISN
ncbi:MAG TPA: hypothetical protein PKW55_05565 [Spirochaetota bacterium]|nr:hypothetical protein [Spirochaetota bacterium]HOM37581.1 hypothetical protein [Spirochaetota bacterium]HPQ49448.1 hypothetical protein [Spirochaetota bacterium]